MKTREIQNFIEEILTKFGITFDSVEDTISESGTLVFTIQSPESQLLIGRDGEVLQSLSHLLKRYVEKQYPENNKNHILLDVNGYQHEKIKKIKTIAHMMAERCRFFKTPVELEPMNPFERHLVHEFIQEQSDLQTESTGFGKDRRVVIIYKK